MKYVVLCLLFVYPAVGATFRVAMSNTKFEPPNLTINVGDTVTWNNIGGLHDTVSGSSGVPSGVWNSNNQFRRLMFPGESFSFTFTTAGNFPYYCTPHWTIGMVGTIRVLAPNSPPSVSILSPPNQADFPAPADITIQAEAADSDGTVTQVAFFMNGAPIGTVSTQPYSVTVNNLGPGNYTFSATATDNSGATGSAAVSVTVSGQQPTITTPPQSQTVNAGSDVVFNVQATGLPPLSYQWLFGPTAIPGANATSLLLTNVTLADSGTYTVQVSNEFGSTSASASLNVTNPPSGTAPDITTQPQSQTVRAGTNVILTAVAIGSTPLFWQWFFTNAAVLDATNSSLELTNVTAANAGGYFAVVTNAFGSTNTSTATLTVIVAPVCTFTLSTNRASFGFEGGFGSVEVATLPDCAWTVANTNGWIAITTRNGGVDFTVAANSTTNVRSGVLLIAGIPFTVTQAEFFSAKNDFNHDGHTDFLWQNANGQVRLWLMHGLHPITKLALRQGRAAPPGSRIVGTHDFNRDQNVDILWQRAGGQLEIWFMRGVNYLRAEFVSAPAVGAHWQVVGLGDFNRDTHMDLLLRHRDGYLRVWYLNGKQLVSQQLLINGESVPPAWRVAGVADVDNDGPGDILWQRADSSIVVWFMQAIEPTSGPLLSRLPRINARIVGLNDLDQDGDLDFIWRHPAGNLTVWWMNGTNRIGSAPVNHGQPVPATWRFVAPGQ